MEVGHAGEAIGPAPGDRPARQLVVARVVAVEDGGLLDSLVRSRSSEVDEPGLRLEVLLPGGVVIEMVATYVGDSGDVQVTGSHPLLDQSVRSRLDDGALDP